MTNGAPHEQKKKLDPETLPEYSTPYFNHLLARYHALHQKPWNDGPGEQKSGWHELYLLERQVKRALTPAEINREVWSLRMRYREIAGLAAYEAYLASKPPSLDDHGNVTDDALSVLRADMEFLLSEIYVGYAMEPRRQETRRQVSRYIGYASIVGLMLVLGSAIIAAVVQKPLPTGAAILPTMFVGAMGALFSMQRRFQNAPSTGDPIFGITQLRRGGMDIFVTASIGAISAAILFLLFSGGLVTGAIFPDMTGMPVLETTGGSTPPAGSDASRTGFFDFMKNAGPKGVAGYAKLLVWAFIAGFAERWVPDTLTQFADRKTAEQEGKP